MNGFETGRDPYQAPETEVRTLDRGQLRLTRILGIFLLFGVIFGILGAGVGYLMAIVIPNYYVEVFDGANRPNFDPVSVGLGLGLIQGIGAGLGLGCVAVLALAIARRRRNDRLSNPKPAASQDDIKR